MRYKLRPETPGPAPHCQGVAPEGGEGGALSLYGYVKILESASLCEACYSEAMTWWVLSLVVVVAWFCGFLEGIGSKDR